MKNLQKLFATIALSLFLGLPVCAGDMNAPPAPPPSTKHTATSSGGAAAASKYTKNVNAPATNMDAATFAINLLVSMLSIY